MWGSEESGPLHWDIQSAVGYRSGYHANASALGSTDGYE